MHRTRSLIATLAVILMAGIVPATGVAHESARALGPDHDAGSVGTSVGSEPSTSLIVICFPTAGCIVCHDGYCEYTKRI